MKLRLLLFLFLIIVLSACSETEERQGKEQEKIKEAVATTVAKESTPVVTEVEQTVEQTEITNAPKVLPQYKINPKNFNIEPIGDAPDHVILLTIDDAPDKHALEMAKTLKNLNVNAIFFVNGHFLQTPEQEAVLKAIHEMGFLIGNHTMTHQNLKTLSNEEQYKEIVELNDLVEKIIGERPKFFRAPHGVNTDYSRQVVADEKMVLMNWSYGYDFMKDYMSKEALTTIMINTELLHKGANLLMHDREWTNEALQDIVIGLENKGYQAADPSLIETIE
ncbi:polysaccharide deacetylase family protein [Schinkia azotoformans]|uniref:polysaccharide deacetylase family protein n=1 Tax=Schinkia azotoformans TaxID=1454 RepID=UPI002DB9AE0D|nr:polysaccharide deacetylase family protein [Schinkia azotoformans]MEC1718187.1 polysaccharide deacetylase family protein [Schinkia azotoformans]MEC1740346.1 polysaccharide deacetylase family protein [Schinkia azotoformans]MEC1747226.1 polysaccharide deacetylase family protein [Schinkia azotoformans]MEC1757320.1 polysaccharide deacetylase family protein [Schinkia azotoformans]MEC1768921.1 polysaccharide deacetylase family protein [Schinkia azotoformans]